MKVISFSLWGSNPVYTVGAIRNAELAKELFPEWKCIFYCFNTVPSEIIQKLQAMDNAIVRLVDSDGDNRGMFNRFLPAEEENIDYYICRDTDSRLSPERN
jgi:protein O-GlcNAc transferase